MSRRCQFVDLVRLLACQNPTYTADECEQVANDLLLGRASNPDHEETPATPAPTRTRNEAGPAER